MGKIRRRADFAQSEATGVPLTFLDDTGQPVKEKFTIVYRSFSRQGIERLEQELEADKFENGNIPYSAMFAKLVISITDQDGEALTDETGATAVLTREFFDGMLPADFESIQRGISGDENPPLPSPAPGLSGSSPGASTD
jgi:hypothetical protein